MDDDRAVWEETVIKVQIQGVSKERKVVLVELAPVAKACEVGREMD